MSDVITTNLGSLAAPGQGYPVKSKSAGAHTLVAAVSGVGALVFTGSLMGSNDNVAWAVVAQLAASGNGVATANVQVSGDYAFWRLDAATLTGTNAVVSGMLSTDSSTSFVGEPLTGSRNPDGSITPSVDTARVVKRITGRVSRPYRVVVGGASRDQAQTNICPTPRARGGWWQNRAGTVNTGGFITGLSFASNCGAADSTTVDFSASRYALRVAVAGDAPGPWVSLAGMGHLELESSSNGKLIFPAIRHRFAPTSDQQWVFVNSNAIAAQPARTGASGIWAGAFARTGLFRHDVHNYAMGEDRAEDLYNRLDQLLGLSADLLCLQIGENTIADTMYWGQKIIEKASAAGQVMLICKTLPAGWNAQERAHWETWNAKLDEIAARNPLVNVVEGGIDLRSTGESGSGFVVTDMYGIGDPLHQSMIASLTRIANRIAPALRRMLPGLTPPRPVVPGDGFHATSNPNGNLVGERALMKGIGGVKGGATGDVPDNATIQVLNGTFGTLRSIAPESVISTYAADSSGGSATTQITIPAGIARDDYPSLKWWQVAAANASASGTTLYLKIALEYAPTVGGKYRASLALQVLGGVGFQGLNASLSYVAGAIGNFRLVTAGTLPVLTATLGDTGILYLDTGEVEIPAGTTGAEIIVALPFAAGGGATVRVADSRCQPKVG